MDRSSRDVSTWVKDNALARTGSLSRRAILKWLFGVCPFSMGLGSLLTHLHTPISFNQDRIENRIFDRVPFDLEPAYRARPGERAWPFQSPRPEPLIQRVTLMAVGDIMMHKANISWGVRPQKGTYDFSPYFELVTPVLKQADWVLGNLETRLAGKKARYTGYPLFNAPDRLANDLKQAGFTLVSTANNHCLDRRKKGIVKTNQTLDAAGLLHTGTFSSQEERNQTLILRKNGLSMAVLAYTYGTNGLPLPKGEPWLVNLINFEEMKKDINRARCLKADFVACMLHFGREYARRPDGRQKMIVKKLFDMGADLVLGSHPHVVQPFQIINHHGQSKVVMYSMGNFLANQFRRYTNLGVIFKVDLIKNALGARYISNVEAIPTRIIKVVKNKRKTFLILPIGRVLERWPEYELPDRLALELKKQNEFMLQHLHSLKT